MTESARGCAECSTINRNFKIDNPDAQKQLEDMLARLERDSRPAPGPGRARNLARGQEPRRQRSEGPGAGSGTAERGGEAGAG